MKDKQKKIFKWVGLSVLALAIIVGGLYLWLFVDSAQAINKYIEAVDQQYAEIVAGKNTDQANVQLKPVALGNVVNGKYKQIQTIDNDYQQLINQLKHYVSVMDVHNQMVSKFNDGIEGDEVLSSDILSLASKMTELTKEYYPDKNDAIDALENLVNKITESTTFADISSDVSTTLYTNDKWLNAEREAIEANRQEFQRKINSI